MILKDKCIKEYQECADGTYSTNMTEKACTWHGGLKKVAFSKAKTTESKPKTTLPPANIEESNNDPQQAPTNSGNGYSWAFADYTTRKGKKGEAIFLSFDQKPDRSTLNNLKNNAPGKWWYQKADQKWVTWSTPEQIKFLESGFEATFDPGAKTSFSIPTIKRNNKEYVIDKLNNVVQSITNKIEGKSDSGLKDLNYTARRGRIMKRIDGDIERLERLRLIAGHIVYLIKNNQGPEQLKGITDLATIETLYNWSRKYEKFEIPPENSQNKVHGDLNNEIYKFSGLWWSMPILFNSPTYNIPKRSDVKPLYPGSSSLKWPSDSIFCKSSQSNFICSRVFRLLSVLRYKKISITVLDNIVTGLHSRNDIFKVNTQLNNLIKRAEKYKDLKNKTHYEIGDIKEYLTLPFARMERASIFKNKWSWAENLNNLLPILEYLSDFRTKEIGELKQKYPHDFNGKTYESKRLTSPENMAPHIKLPGYHNTPKEVVERLLTVGDLKGFLFNNKKATLNVLEPSAGAGDMIRALISMNDSLNGPKLNIDAVEFTKTLSDHLKKINETALNTDKVNTTIYHDDFLTWKPNKLYDIILMNPPFEKLVDIDHVKKAYSHLAPGGRLFGIMGEGAFFRSDKKAVAFREWKDESIFHEEKLNKGEFKKSRNSTGVNSRIIILDSLKVASPIPKVIKEKTDPTSNERPRFEYVVWGVPPGKTMEELLFEYEPETTKRITDKRGAEAIVRILKRKGFKNLRIQTIDFARTDISSDWVKTVGTPSKKQIKNITKEKNKTTDKPKANKPKNAPLGLSPGLFAHREKRSVKKGPQNIKAKALTKGTGRLVKYFHDYIYLLVAGQRIKEMVQTSKGFVWITPLTGDKVEANYFFNLLDNKGKKHTWLIEVYTEEAPIKGKFSVIGNSIGSIKYLSEDIESQIINMIDNNIEHKQLEHAGQIKITADEFRSSKAKALVEEINKSKFSLTDLAINPHGRPPKYYNIQLDISSMGGIMTTVNNIDIVYPAINTAYFYTVEYLTEFDKFRRLSPEEVNQKYSMYKDSSSTYETFKKHGISGIFKKIKSV